MLCMALFSTKANLCALPLALLICASAGVHAQDAPSPDAPPPPSKAKAQEQVEALDPSQTLKVSVNLVDIYFSARETTTASSPA